MSNSTQKCACHLPPSVQNGSACVLNILNAWLPSVFSKGGTSVSLSVHMTPGHSTAPERITFRRSELPQWFLKSSHSPQSESQHKCMSLDTLSIRFTCMCACVYVCAVFSLCLGAYSGSFQTKSRHFPEINNMIACSMGPVATATNLSPVILESTLH